MKNNEITIIVRVILIVGVILCGISQLLPWMTFTYAEGISGVEFYPWAIRGYATGFDDNWVFFYMESDFFGQFSELQIQQLQLVLFTLITFILGLVALILGIVAIIKADKKKGGSAIAGGVIALASAIIFFIGISFVFSQYDQIAAVAEFFNYSFGFYLMLISGILMICAYFPKLAMKDQSFTQGQPPMYQPPPTQKTPPPQMQQPVQQSTPTPPPPPVTQPSQQTPEQPVKDQTVQEKQQTNVPPPPQQPTYKPALKGYCPKCGVKLRPGSAFCSNCGFKL